MQFGNKSHFLRDIRRRFALRLHMAAILLATACSGVLASKLLLYAGFKSLAMIYTGDWVGSVFATTWKPFLVTCIMALLAGGLLNYYFPGVSKVAEILRRG